LPCVLVGFRSFSVSMILLGRPSMTGAAIHHSQVGWQAVEMQTGGRGPLMMVQCQTRPLKGHRTMALSRPAPHNETSRPAPQSGVSSPLPGGVAAAAMEQPKQQSSAKRKKRNRDVTGAAGASGRALSFSDPWVHFDHAILNLPASSFQFVGGCLLLAPTGCSLEAALPPRDSREGVRA